MERQQGTGNGWALSLDDLDVCQLLPLRGDQFDQGVLVLPDDRQWSYDPELLYKHPESQTDPFILFIKSSILLSKVKTYNLRFRWKFFNNDGAPSSSTNSAAFDPALYDATATADFQQLDSLCCSRCHHPEITHARRAVYRAEPFPRIYSATAHVHRCHERNQLPYRVGRQD